MGLSDIFWKTFDIVDGTLDTYLNIKGGFEDSKYQGQAYQEGFHHAVNGMPNQMKSLRVRNQIQKYMPKSWNNYNEGYEDGLRQLQARLVGTMPKRLE
jgi:hypothetical protein